MTAHPSDPVETPLPRPRTDPGAQSLEGMSIHAECLHPELIDRVRQKEKWRVPIYISAGTLIGGSLVTIAMILYSQGADAGATRVRVEQIEDRAREDREEASDVRERQRQIDEAASVRHTELLQELHRIDIRLGRIEERQSPQR
jgi:hypothetical protein